MPPSAPKPGSADPAPIEIDLQDWQDAEHRASDVPASIRLVVTVSPCALRIAAQDGREVVLEMQNGTLRVLSYAETVSDGPVVVEIPATGDITADAQAFHEARIPSGTEPSP